MRTIKMPMTDKKGRVSEWAEFVAMDSWGVWYAYNKPPTAIERGGRWSLKETGEVKGRCEFVCAKTPELLNLLDWKQSLFTVEELLCQP